MVTLMDETTPAHTDCLVGILMQLSLTKLEQRGHFAFKRFVFNEPDCTLKIQQARMYYGSRTDVTRARRAIEGSRRTLLHMHTSAISGGRKMTSSPSSSSSPHAMI